MRITFSVLLTTGVLALLSFQNAQQPLFEKNGLKIFEAAESAAFANATLELETSGTVLPVGKDSFKFKVENYTLGAQTPDAEQKLCANSAKGQHIHFIMDNQPYFASYNSTIGWDVKEGHHVLLAFLSRSYHESLKTKKAYVLREFNAGENWSDNFNEKAPHIFFSRPKGEYLGRSETQRLLLDFYLVNCTLSPKGYKVRATINGTDFLLTKWAPYFIEGLPLGEVKVKLELLNKKGELVPSPFNPCERTVVLKDTK